MTLSVAAAPGWQAIEPELAGVIGGSNMPVPSSRGAR
jgi:hypothetical protein